jgi:hypothetical protein
MERFKAVLVPGRKPPYTTWTFIEIPAARARALGHGPVRGTLAGTSFRGTASRSAGTLRVPVPRALLERAGVARGDRVEVTLERDLQPRPVRIPAELKAVLADEPTLAAAFEALPLSHRRAWAQHVAEAKQPETRKRRADKARAGIRQREFPR